MTTPTLDTVTQRLDRLEREVRRWRRGATVLIALAAAMLVTGQSLPKPRLIEAEKFIVKDETGRVRAIFGAEHPDAKVREPSALRPRSQGDMYGLHLYGQDGRYGAGLIDEEGGGAQEGGAQGARLELHDRTTASSAYLSVSAGAAGLELSATDDSQDAANLKAVERFKRMRVAKTPEEKHKAMSASSLDGVHARLSAFTRGTSLIELRSAGPRGPRGGAQVGLLGDGLPMVYLTDARGKVRALLGRASTGGSRPSLILFDEDGGGSSGRRRDLSSLQWRRTAYRLTKPARGRERRVSGVVIVPSLSPGAPGSHTTAFPRPRLAPSEGQPRALPPIRDARATGAPTTDRCPVLDSSRI